MKLCVSILSLFFYCSVVAILMYTNSVYLDGGDARSAAGGWASDWFLWAIAYLPAVLYALVLNWHSNDTMKEFIKCNVVFTLFLSLVIEITFMTDLSWRFLVIEFAIIGIVWIYVLKFKKFLTRRFT